MTTKVFAKKLFGVRYEKILRNLVISFVLYFGLINLELSIVIAPFVICLMSMFIMVFEMWHALTSDENAANMKRLFMLPVNRREFVLSYIGCLGGYVLLTRVIPLMAVILAVSKVSIYTIITAVLCLVNGVLLSAGVYAWKKFRAVVIIWLLAILPALYFLANPVIWIVLAISAITSFIFILNTDSYAFYNEEGHRAKSTFYGSKASVWAYIWRYLSSHKNYLVNCGIMWIVGVILPFFFKELVETSADLRGFVIPIGFAILCLNTPINILISSDMALEEAIRYLPGQKRTFLVPYCMFVFCCNLIANVIYLFSVNFILGGVTIWIILGALIIALQSALLSVFLEYYFPLRNWKIENELWHHPRKYIVPATMILLAGLIGLVPQITIVLGVVLLIEIVVVISSFLLAKRTI